MTKLQRKKNKQMAKTLEENIQKAYTKKKLPFNARVRIEKDALVIEILRAKP